MSSINGGQDSIRDAWEQVCLDSYSLLKLAARRLAKGNDYDAEDLVQETVRRALTYAKDPGTIDSPSGYLLQVMRNVWKDRWSKQDADMISLDQSAVGDEVAPQLPVIAPEALRNLENSELIDELKFKAGPLTDRERLLLELHLNGFSSVEIAEALNDDVKIIRVDLNAVVAKVRYRLKRHKASTT